MCNLHSFSTIKMSYINYIAEYEAAKSQLTPELHESSWSSVEKDLGKYGLFRWGEEMALGRPCSGLSVLERSL